MDQIKILLAKLVLLLTSLKFWGAVGLGLGVYQKTSDPLDGLLAFLGAFMTGRVAEDIGASARVAALPKDGDK